MWENLSKSWKVCFEEAWEAYCHGSIPIGAVLMDSDGEIVSRGRNRTHENTAPSKQTCSNRLAHAEINALLQINFNDSDKLRNYTLYTSTEPCVLCFGAITMSGVRKVRFAASDPIAGGANLNDSENTFIKSRNIDIKREEKYLGNIQRVLRTDYVLRNLGENAERFLMAYSMEYPEAVQLGKKWFEENRLNQAMNKKISIGTIVDEISEKLKCFPSI